MGSDFAQAQGVVRAAGLAGGDPLTMPLEQARAAQEAILDFLRGTDLPPVAGIEELEAEGPKGPVPLRIFRPLDVACPPVILLVRGCGWWHGKPDSHDRTARLLASATGCAVVPVHYRRMPEYAYPVQRDEVLSAIDWLRARGSQLNIAADDLVLCGESAGATLCLSVALALRDTGQQPPRGLVLFYGNFAGPFAAGRPYSRWVWSQYLRDPLDEKDPGAVPLLGEMRGLPPAWLGVGDEDPLLADSQALAAKLAAAGVPQEIRVYPGLPHGFVPYSRLSPAVRSVVADAAHAVRRFMNKEATEEPMERWTPTQEEMKTRLARFRDVVPTKKRHLEEKGIPEEVLEMISAKTTRNIMSPGPLPGQLSPKPVVEGGDAGVFRLGIVSCPPGQGPGLHCHHKTHETFLALSGRWEVQWGDRGEESLVLDPYDLLAVPPGVTRRFVNLADEEAHLLVVIQGKPEEFDDVDRVASTAEAIARKHGQAMVEKLNNLGWQFNIGAKEKAPA